MQGGSMMEEERTEGKSMLYLVSDRDWDDEYERRKRGYIFGSMIADGE
jgi:hypothetical protein